MAGGWNIVGIAAGTAFCGLLAVLFFARPLLRAASEIRSLPKMVQGALAALALVATLNADKLRSGASVECRVKSVELRNDLSTLYTLNSQFRLDSVATNDSYSYAMPSDGVRYSNWWLRGAYEDVFRLDLGGMPFPLGTNLCDSLWVYTWGMAGMRLGDASGRIVATGVPMSAVPGLSRFWSAAADDGGRLLTWENFFLNRDTNTPVSAQLELMPSGDFIARSNHVERLYRRVNPDDWDDDGDPNDTDPNPLVHDGDNFGPRQTLPDGANTNAYCWVDLVVPDANALVTFTGDGYSALPDPTFIARAGATNRVIVLIGKTYEVTSRMPITCIRRSSGEIEVEQTSPTGLRIVWPVTIEVESGDLRMENYNSLLSISHFPLSTLHSTLSPSFSMSVWPDCLGGGFAWTNSCCSIDSLGGGAFSYSCNDACHCGGCFAAGYYGYEGYSLPADGGWCGCEGEYDPPPEGEEDDGPHAPGASATFSKSAVIFEDGYWNTPDEWVERQSSQTELRCVAHGGPNGGRVRFEVSAGAEKLQRVLGHLLPVEQDVGPGMRLDFTVIYEGRLPSAAEDDIIVTTTFTENVPDAEPEVSTDGLTSVKVELIAVESAAGNPCVHRRTYGVNEWVRVICFPVVSNFLIDSDGGDVVVGAGNDEFFCPWTGGDVTLVMRARDAMYQTPIHVVEPRIVCREAIWDGVLGTVGCAGQLQMNLFLHVMPTNVSFDGIFLVEIPVDEPCVRAGYFEGSDTNKVGALSHNVFAGAGRWLQVHGSEWTVDAVGRRTPYPPPWSDGWKEWDIPVGWGDVLHTLKGRIVPDPTTQRFTLDANGTASIIKYGHAIERRTDNAVRVDGVLQ